jgi:hypothetical protein
LFKPIDGKVYRLAEMKEPEKSEYKEFLKEESLRRIELKYGEQARRRAICYRQMTKEERLAVRLRYGGGMGGFLDWAKDTFEREV